MTDPTAPNTDDDTAHNDAGTNPPGDDTEQPPGPRTTGWGRLAYITLTLITLATIWALVIVSIAVVHNGQRTDELIDLLARGQQSREQTIGDLQRSREDTLALLIAYIDQSRQQRSDTSEQLAQLRRDNTDTRQSIAQTLLAVTTSRAHDLSTLTASLLRTRSLPQDISAQLSALQHHITTITERLTPLTASNLDPATLETDITTLDNLQQQLADLLSTLTT